MELVRKTSFHELKQQGKRTENMATEKTLTDASVSEIDKALNAAKARKQNREGKPAAAASSTAEKPAKAAKAPKEPSAPKRPRLTDEHKAEREAAKVAERAATKAARDEARAAKRAERDSTKQPAHMRKVAKAAERLGTLNESAQLIFNEATANLTAADLATLALHIQHFNRVKATERALTQTITEGMSVSIVGGDPRFIGQTGTVTKAQRIRCYVQVTGAKKPVYLFTSDVQPVNAAAAPVSAAAAG
jgi:chemotaxis protein histidine kinase CheA